MKRFLLTIMASLAMLAAMAQSITHHYAFEGTLDGKIAVRLTFEANDLGIAAGEITYTKTKTPTPILVVGSVEENSFYLYEYQSDGKRTGGYIAVTVERGKLSGKWFNLDNDKEYSFTAMRPVAFPKSAEGILTPESPDHIGQHYGYWFHNVNVDADFGGHFDFRGAGKNRIHFEAANVPMNVAEGKSEEGRPAVLQGNHFTYLHMNECDYGFEVYFYPRFMVARDVTDNETLVGCFGAHTTLAGVYIKTKQ